MSGLKTVVSAYASDFTIFIETEVVLKANERSGPQGTRGDANLGTFHYEKRTNADTNAIGVHPVVFAIGSQCGEGQGRGDKRDRVNRNYLFHYFLLFLFSWIGVVLRQPRPHHEFARYT